MEWYVAVLKKYTVFSGRARRKEYWMFCLFSFIITLALGFIEGLFGGPGLISMVYSLFVFIPSLAVTTRRLHDTGRSGWWFLIIFIPLIGAIALLVFMVLDSQAEHNDFGENPKSVTA